MATRSLNKVQLIGNLTRDPELRYTPQGTAVCTFGLATNRQWTTEQGEKREEVEFHRITAWTKLAELCAQLLFKGRRVYIEGRLQTRSWTAQDGTNRQVTEIVANDMIILDNKRVAGEAEETEAVSPTGETPQPAVSPETKAEPVPAAQPKKSIKKDEKEEDEGEIKADDIPF